MTKKTAGYFDSNRDWPMCTGDVYKDAGLMSPYFKIIQETDKGFMVHHLESDEKFLLSRYGQKLLNMEYVGNTIDNPDLLNSLDDTDVVEQVQPDDFYDAAEEFAEVEQNKADFTDTTPSISEGFTEDGEYVSQFTSQQSSETVIEPVERENEVESAQCKCDDIREMTQSEARDYVEEEIDEKFMDDVSPQKMSPEKAAKRIKELEETNEKYQERVEELEPIQKVWDLDVLRNLVKEQTHNAIDDIEGADAKENSKTAKDGIRGLESIAYVESLISIAVREYNNKKNAIKENDHKIEELKHSGFQQSLFDEQQEVSEEAAAESEATQNTLATEIETNEKEDITEDAQ